MQITVPFVSVYAMVWRSLMRYLSNLFKHVHHFQCSSVLRSLLLVSVKVFGFDYVSLDTTTCGTFKVSGSNRTSWTKPKFIYAYVLTVATKICDSYSSDWTVETRVYELFLVCFHKCFQFLYTFSVWIQHVQVRVFSVIITTPEHKQRSCSVEYSKVTLLIKLFTWKCFSSSPWCCYISVLCNGPQFP